VLWQTEKQKNQVMKLMQQLGETCRKILMMVYYENLSVKEIL
jgi:DNA-directed RNA polymerase specialized sigma24 family protein